MSGSTFSVPQSALMDTDGQNSSRFLTDCGKINSYIWSSSANPLIYGMIFSFQLLLLNPQRCILILV